MGKERAILLYFLNTLHHLMSWWLSASAWWLTVLLYIWAGLFLFGVSHCTSSHAKEYIGLQSGPRGFNQGIALIHSRIHWPKQN